MPLFPRYDSQRQLTTQQPEVMPAENANAKITGIMAEGVGKVADATVKWSNAVDTIQTTTAKANFEVGEADIRARAEADPNYNNSDSYIKELNKLKTESLKGFMNSGARNNMAFELDHQSAVSAIKINGIYRKKMVDVGQASALRLIDQQVNNPGPDTEKNIKAVIEAQIQAGIYDRKAGYELEKKALKDANWNRFALTAKTNRDEARKLAESGALNFDSEQADKAMNYLNNLKNLEDKNTLIDKIDNRYNLIDAISNGKEDIFNLSPAAQAMVNSDEVLAAAIQKGQQKGKGYIPETTDVENYVKIFDDASKATDQDALSKLVMDAIYRDKTITPDKLGLVVFYANQRAKNLMLSEKILEPIGTETTPEQLQAMQMDAGVNRIARWARSSAISVKEHSAAITDFINNVKGGMKPVDAVNATMKSANLRLHPEMINYPKEGQMLVDAKGNFAMAYPDGTIVPMAQQTTKKTTQKPPGKEKAQVSWEAISK